MLQWQPGQALSNSEHSKTLEQDFGRHGYLRDSPEFPAGLTSLIFNSFMGSMSRFEVYNQYKGL